MLERYVLALSYARTLDEIMDVVTKAARDLTGADGATVVLRQGHLCYYADEDAIAPLWKGRRFRMKACISGWVMETGNTAIIEDIYRDSRIPHDAYRPTFVKSLVMAPIRQEEPIGAIGTYWAHQQRPSDAALDRLKAFAAAASVAFENVELRESSRQSLDSAAALEAENRDLKLFSHAVAHDLRAPLRAMSGFAQILSDASRDGLAEPAVSSYLSQIHKAVQRMAGSVDGLERLARLDNQSLKYERFCISTIAEETAEALLALEAQRPVVLAIAPNLRAHGDPGLLQVMLQNFISNALKFTRERTAARIEFGAVSQDATKSVYFVRDNGQGFAMEGSEKMLMPFARLHADSFDGFGIGMTTISRIVERHGGELWWESKIDQGTTFYFSLPNLTPAEVDPAAR